MVAKIPMAMQMIKIPMFIARLIATRVFSFSTSITEFIKYTPGIKNKTLEAMATSYVAVSPRRKPI